MTLLPILKEIPIWLYFSLLSFSFSIYAADTLRFLLFAKALNINLPVRVALDAVIACLFFGWITPGSSMGAPAGAFILKKNGIPWDSSLAISVGKSMTGISLLLIVAMSLLLFGFGPEFKAYYLGPIIFTAFFIILIFIVFPLFARLFNRQIIDFLQNKKYTRSLIKIINQIDYLFDAPKIIIFYAFLSHILYFILFISPAALLCFYFGANFTSGFNHSLIYTAFSYIAPTPGGAGIAEAASSIFYNKILNISSAITVVLLFRFFTFYFQIYFGGFYLFIIRQIRFDLTKK